MHSAEYLSCLQDILICSMTVMVWRVSELGSCSCDPLRHCKCVCKRTFLAWKPTCMQRASTVAPGTATAQVVQQQQQPDTALFGILLVLWRCGAMHLCLLWLPVFTVTLPGQGTDMCFVLLAPAALCGAAWWQDPGRLPSGRPSTG
jgi:hypothetical protein